MQEIKLSKLGHTWIFDLDGTLVKHNGYKDGEEALLPGVKEFFDKIPNDDYILILTSREDGFKEITESYLEMEGIRYDRIIFGVPMGERILFNDDKPSGLSCGHAVRLERDKGLSDFSLIIDDEL